MAGNFDEEFNKYFNNAGGQDFDAELNNYFAGRQPLPAFKRPEPQAPPIEQPKPSGGLGSTIKDQGIKFAQGTVDVGNAVLGLGDLVTGGNVSKGLSSVGMQARTDASNLNKYLSPEQQQADNAVANADGFGGTLAASLQNPRSILGSVSRSMPGTIAGMVPGGLLARGLGQVAMATKAGQSAVLGAGAATEGLQSTGEIASQSQANGREWKDYALPAVAAGAGTAGINMLSGKLFGDAATDIVAGTNTMKGGLLGKIAKGAATEGVAEEMPQSAQEQYFGNVAEGRDGMEGVGGAAASGLLAGAAMGGMFGGASAVKDKLVGATGQPITDDLVQSAAAGGTLSRALVNTATTTPAQEQPELTPEQDDQARADDLQSRFKDSVSQSQMVSDTHKDAVTLRNDWAESEGLHPKEFEIMPLQETGQFIVRRKVQEDAAQDIELQNRDRSNVSSVAQMQKIAANPDYERASVGSGMDEAAPMVSSKANSVQLPDTQLGTTGNAIFADGEKIPFRYGVVEAGDISTSHDASGNINRNYGQDDRLTALNNGRTAGVKEAYVRGNAADYKAKLAEDSRHGVPSETIQAMQSPVLVRLYDDAANQQIQNIGAKSNQRANLSLGAVEQAKTDANTFPDDLVFGVQDNDLTSTKNTDFVRSVLGTMVPDNERANLLDASGQLSQTGLRRVQSALALKAYQAPEIIQDNFESNDPEIRSIGNSLVNAAPSILQMRTAINQGNVSKDWDITSDLASAAKLVRQARAESKPIAQFVQQNNLDPADNVQPGVVNALQLMFKDDQFKYQKSAKQISDSLQKYANAAIGSGKGQDMYGETATPQAVLQSLIGAPKNDNRTETSNVNVTDGADRLDSNAGGNQVSQPIDAGTISNQPASAGGEAGQAARTEPGLNLSQPSPSPAISAGQERLDLTPQTNQGVSNNERTDDAQTIPQQASEQTQQEVAKQPAATAQNAVADVPIKLQYGRINTDVQLSDGQVIKASEHNALPNAQRLAQARVIQQGIKDKTVKAYAPMGTGEAATNEAKANETTNVPDGVNNPATNGNAATGSGKASNVSLGEQSGVVNNSQRERDAAESSTAAFNSKSNVKLPLIEVGYGAKGARLARSNNYMETERDLKLNENGIPFAAQGIKSDSRSLMIADKAATLFYNEIDKNTGSPKMDRIILVNPINDQVIAIDHDGKPKLFAYSQNSNTFYYIADVKPVSDQQDTQRDNDPQKKGAEASTNKNSNTSKLAREYNKKYKDILFAKALANGFIDNAKQEIDRGNVTKEQALKIYNDAVNAGKLKGNNKTRAYRAISEMKSNPDVKFSFAGPKAAIANIGTLEQATARNTQARQNLTAEERKNTNPEKTQDVDSKDQKAYTKESFIADLKTELDKAYGNGFTDRLLGTGSVKVVDAKEAGRIVGNNALFHKVWHGSPHDYNKFDLSKIGTGEGAQAFGYGLYFTDEKSIAEWYREYLSDAKNVPTHKIGERVFLVSGMASNNFNNIKVGAMDGSAVAPMESKALYAMQRFKNNKEDAKQYLLNEAKTTPLKPQVAVYEGAASLIDSIINIKGKLYEVELAPKEDEYLDWNKSLGEQSDHVKLILRKFVDNFQETNGVNEVFISDRIHNEADGKSIYKVMSAVYESDKAASDHLHSLGIRGIKYAAEGGKSDAKNYVVFDDNDIQIVAKYSKNDVAQAFYNYDDKTTYFIYDNIEKGDDLKGLALHEIGVHALQLGKNDEEFLKILDHMYVLKKSGNKLVKQAFDRVPPDTPPEDVAHESLAYLVQYHPELKLTQRFMAWLRNAVRAIGKSLPALQRAKWYQWANNLNEKDLVYMANAALKSAPDSIKNAVKEPFKSNWISDITGDGTEYEGKFVYNDGAHTSPSVDTPNKYNAKILGFPATVVKTAGHTEITVYDKYTSERFAKDKADAVKREVRIEGYKSNLPVGKYVPVGKIIGSKKGIDHIVVSNVYRRQGIAKAMLDFAKKDGTINIYKAEKLSQNGADLLNKYHKVSAERLRQLNAPPAYSKDNQGVTEAQRQYNEVESKYFNPDGSEKSGAMLAPNGERTNLNKVQWIQTRTDNFKNWFGDFINDPENSSKVVDENGDPQVFFHGTSSDEFTIFKEKTGGIYFTTDPVLADTFTYASSTDNGYVGHYFITGKNVFDARWRQMDESKKKELEKIISINFDDDDNATIADDLGREDWTAFESFTDGELWIDTSRADQDRVIYNIFNHGYDLIIFPDSPSPGENAVSYVVKKANQIKSADDNAGEFSSANPDIRFSKIQRAIFGVKDEPVRTLKDFDDVLSTGVMPDRPIEPSEKADKLVELFVDSTRPFDVWSRILPDQTSAFELIHAKDRAITRKNAFEREAMLKFGKDISIGIRNAMNAAGWKDYRATKEMVGHWMSARYAQIANRNLLRQYQSIADDAQNALDDFNLSPDPNMSAQEVTAERKRLQTALTKANNNLAKFTAALNNPAVIDPNDTKHDIGLAGGYNDATAKHFMAEIEKVFPKDKLIRAALPVQNMNEWKLQQDIANGKVTQEVADKFDQSGYYVPLTGDPRNDDSTDDFFTTGNVNQSKDKRLQGRKTGFAQNGIDASFEQLEKSAKYHGWVDFKDKLTEIYDKLVADNIAQGMTEQEAVRQVREDYDITREGETGTVRPSDDGIIVRKDGKAYVYKINNKAAIDALKSTNKEQLNSALNAVRFLTSWNARFVTQLMPMFAPVNMVRDVIEKSENIRQRQLANYAAVDMSKVGRRVLGIFGTKAPKLAYKIATIMAEGTSFANKLKVDNNDPETQAIKQFLNEGGSASWSDYLGKDSKGLSEKLEFTSSKGKNITDLIEIYNNAFELVSGYSVYKALREQGVDSKTAATTSLNLFNMTKQGSVMAPIRAMYMFAQPSLTSAHNLAVTLKTRQGKVRYAVMLGVGMALYSLLRAGQDDDELGVNKLDELGNYTLSRNIVIPMGDDKFVKLPVGFGISQLAWAHAINVVKWANGSQSAGETLSDILYGGVKIASPVAPSDTSIADHPFIWAMQSFTPQIAKGVGNIALDVTAMGNKLTPAFVDPMKAKALQSKKTTPEAYKEVAKVLAGFGVDTHPEQVREFIKSYIPLPSLFGSLMKEYIDNPSREDRGQSTVSPLLDRWITAQDKDQLTEKLFYRRFDEAKKAQAKRTAGRSLDDRETRLADLAVAIDKQLKASNGKQAAATKADRSGKKGLARVKQRQADDLRQSAMARFIKAYQDLEGWHKKAKQV